MATYLTPSGVACSKQAHEQALEESRDEDGKHVDPYLIKQFENDTIRVSLMAQRKIMDARIPEKFWKRATVQVENIMTTDAAGNALDAPRRAADVDATRDFHTVEEAHTYYQSFLVEWAKCQRNADGSVKEVGNKLAPKPADEPTVNASTQSILGMW